MCGFDHSTFFTVPVTLTGFVASYSAEKAWCANRATENANTAPAARIANFFISDLQMLSSLRLAGVYSGKTRDEMI